MASYVLILAAGQGTRMRSGRPKVLHHLAGLPLIAHVLRAARAVIPDSQVVVVGHMADQVRAGLADHASLGFVLQTEQRGTGHALLQAETLLGGLRGSLVVLSGDVPLIRPDTLRQLLETHQRTDAALTLLTATLARPFGYGRILRKNGRLSRVVEERDASEAQRQLREINSGIYALALAPLFDALRDIPVSGALNEIYLPGLVTIYRRRGLGVETVGVENSDEVRGINSQTELAEVRQIVRQRKNEELMAAGVTIEDPATTYVDTDVTVGPDTVIHPGVTLEGRTRIGARCELHSGVRIVDSTLGDDVLINNYCVILGTTIAQDARIGPFAHLRPETVVGKAARIGNFVETKKTSLGEGSKANHLTYLGDATIGNGVNVGAGTITCNYDGTEKHPTTIGDRVFIGSGTELIAPVTLGNDAYVAAGSCITNDVPAGALSVARAQQVNKDNWVARRKKSHDAAPSDV
jgi:bifunctional UDP-N-acetylglucosamine pyrophosphorylase/glucosamine-1-phosphate N-acetyltransferase